MPARNKENAQIISDMVNDFNFNAKGVCEELSKEHRTLQQNFTRLCIEWLKTCASDEYRYDARNADSRKVACDIDQALYDAGISLNHITLEYI